MADNPMPKNGFRPRGQTNILADARIQKLDDTALLFPAGLLTKPAAEDLVFAAVEMMATFANVVIVSLRHVYGVTDSGVEVLHTLSERVVQAGGFIYLCDLGAGTRAALDADGVGREMTIADALGDILREEGMDRARIHPAHLRFRPQGVLREPTPEEAQTIANRLADAGADIRFRTDGGNAPVGEFSSVPPSAPPESVTQLNLHNEPIPPAEPPRPRPRPVRSGTRAFTSILEAEVTPIFSGEVMSETGGSLLRRRRGKRRRQTFTSVIKSPDIGFRQHDSVPGLLVEEEEEEPGAESRPHPTGTEPTPTAESPGTEDPGGSSSPTVIPSRRRRRRQTFTSIIDVSVLPTEEEEEADAVHMAEAVEALDVSGTGEAHVHAVATGIGVSGTDTDPGEVDDVEVVEAVEAEEVEAVEAVEAAEVEAEPGEYAIDPALLSGPETKITPAPRARKLTLDALVDASTSSMTRGPLEPHIGTADTPPPPRPGVAPSPYTSIVDVPVSTDEEERDPGKGTAAGRRNRFFTEQFAHPLPADAPTESPPGAGTLDETEAAVTNPAETKIPADAGAQAPESPSDEVPGTGTIPVDTLPDQDVSTEPGDAEAVAEGVPEAGAAPSTDTSKPFIPESRPDSLPDAFAPIARDKVEMPKEKKSTRARGSSRKIDTSVIGSSEPADLGPSPKDAPQKARGPLKIEINRPHITERRTIGQIRHDVRIDRIGDIAFMRPQIEIDRQAWDEMMAASVSVMSTFANTLILSFESVDAIPESGAALIRTLQERVTRAGGLFYLTDVPEASLAVLRQNNLLGCVEKNLTMEAYLDAMGLMKEQLRPVKLRSDTVLFMKTLGTPTGTRDGMAADELGLDGDFHPEEEEEETRPEAPKERVCPECKKPVSPDALKCPHCKYNLALEKMFRNLSALADAMDDAKFSKSPPKPGVLPSGPDASFAGGVRPAAPVAPGVSQPLDSSGSSDQAPTASPQPDSKEGTPPSSPPTPLSKSAKPGVDRAPDADAPTASTSAVAHTETEPRREETPEERKQREKAEREKRAAIILEKRRKEKEAAAREAITPPEPTPPAEKDSALPPAAKGKQKKTSPSKSGRASARAAASPKAVSASKPKLKKPRKVEPKKKSAVPCPSCGKPIEGDVLVCYHCKYNVNLAGRLMKQSPLAGAIKEASLPAGVRADGSTYKTRKEKIEEHVASGRLRGRALIVAALFVLSIPLIRIFAAVRESVRIPGLQELRTQETIPSPANDNIRSWHPYYTGVTLRPEFMLDRLQIRPLVFSRSIDEELDAGAVLAESLSLPVAHLPRNIGWQRAEAIRRAVERIGGAYTPSAIHGGFTQRNPVLWREAPDLREAGSLRGVVLDFGPRQQEEIQRIQEALREEQEAEIQFYRRIEEARARAEEYGMFMRLPELIREAGPPRKRLVRVEGILTFIPIREDRLQGGAGSYADALRTGADFVRYPGGGGREEGVEKFPAERWFFVPVLQVSAPLSIRFSEERIPYRLEMAERLTTPSLPADVVTEGKNVPPE